MKVSNYEYIIDGYNVLHKIAYIGLNGFSTKNRTDFVNFLEKRFPKLNILLIFDGYPNLEEKTYSSFIKVKFSRNKSADDLILNIVKDIGYKDNILVITDDRELKNSLKKYRVSTEKVAVFLKRCYNNKITHAKAHDLNKPDILSRKGINITKYLYNRLTGG